MADLLAEETVVPATHRGRETKARIIGTAADLMFEQGVATTSVDDILVAAGVGKSQFYHYFAAKDDLIEAVLRHQLAGVLRYQRQFDVATWDGLLGWLASLVMQPDEPDFGRGCPLGSLVAEVADRDERLRTVAAEAFARWEAELATGLRSLRAAGQLRADADPAALAEEVLAIIQGGYLLTMAKRKPRPMQNAVAAAIARLRSYAA